MFVFLDLNMAEGLSCVAQKLSQGPGLSVDPIQRLSTGVSRSTFTRTQDEVGLSAGLREKKEGGKRKEKGAANEVVARLASAFGACLARNPPPACCRLHPKQ